LVFHYSIIEENKKERYSRVPRLSDTQLMGPREIAKRDWNAPPTRDLNMWLCGR